MESAPGFGQPSAAGGGQASNGQWAAKSAVEPRLHELDTKQLYLLLRGHADLRHTGLRHSGGGDTEVDWRSRLLYPGIRVA